MTAWRSATTGSGNGNGHRGVGSRAAWITPAVNTYILLGDSHFALKQYDKALEAYREAAGLKRLRRTGSCGVFNRPCSPGDEQYDLGIEHLQESLRLNRISVMRFCDWECYFFTEGMPSRVAMEKVVRMRPKDTSRRIARYAYVSLRRLRMRGHNTRRQTSGRGQAEMLLKEIERRSN